MNRTGNYYVRTVFEFETKWRRKIMTDTNWLTIKASFYEFSTANKNTNFWVLVVSLSLSLYTSIYVYMYYMRNMHEERRGWAGRNERPRFEAHRSTTGDPLTRFKANDLINSWLMSGFSFQARPGLQNLCTVARGSTVISNRWAHSRQASVARSTNLLIYQ